MARILIVDDSPTEMYKLTAMLEKHGHQVLKAENGADGVALARVHVIEPHGEGQGMSTVKERDQVFVRARRHRPGRGGELP